MIARTLVLACALAVGLAGCGTDAEEEVTITIGAAASLTDVLPRVAEAFEAANPGVRVTLTFAGTSTIAEQIMQGAPIDVIAAAGSGPVEPLVAEGLVGDAQPFATNSLAIAVPPGNPAAVAGLADLARVSVAICQEQVPCGSATIALIEKNSLVITPVTLERDVRAVLTKIASDEVDAGIVYATDVVSAGSDIESLDIPAEANVTTTYPIAAVNSSEHLEAARAFIAFIVSSEGQSILAEAGFGRP